MLNDALTSGNLSASIIRYFEIRPLPRQKQEVEACFAGRLKRLIRFRRAREAAFGAELFCDPAWDMLLDLCIAGESTRKVSVSSLCIASTAPSTTALRWITVLEEKGLVQRQADPDDRRRTFISLTPETEVRLRKLLCHWMGLSDADGSVSITAAS